MKFIKKCFIIGLIAVVLVGLIIWILKFIWNFLAPFKYIVKLIFAKPIPGFEIVVILIFIFIIGVLINLLEKRVGIGQQAQNVSFIRRILNFFSTIKNTVSYWLSEKSSELKNQKNIYVVVEVFPGFSVLGMTAYNEITVDFYDENGAYHHEKRIAIAVISWPFPTTGPIVIFARPDMIYELKNVPPEVIVQLIMSATLLKINPDQTQSKTDSSSQFYAPV